jgi:hypothetical protein
MCRVLGICSNLSGYVSFCVIFPTCSCVSPCFLTLFSFPVL